MRSRLELHAVLCDVLGSSDVYFRPPEQQRMRHPCIIYDLAQIEIRHADNAVYLQRPKYDITYVTDNPDLDEVHDKLVSLPYCRFAGSHTSDGLEHKRYEIYF